MKKMSRIIVTSLATLLMITLADARGQEMKYRFEFFGGAGLPIRENFTISSPQSVLPLKGSHKFSPGAQAGVRIGTDSHRYWGMDYAYSYGANASKIVTPYGQFAFTNRIHQASASVLFYPWGLDRAKFFPYVTAGVGASFVTLSQDTLSEALDPLRAGIGELKSEKIFALNAGLGARIRMSPRYDLRLDVRDYISRPLRYGLPKTSSDPNAAVLPVSGVSHLVAPTIGIVIHF